jgi:glycosyltransferase involved in cell wall biosynthesis
MRICLIGPSYPFRGGLAHHTTLLYRHLRQRHHVIFYAFKRQYPQWLFPGETDRDMSKAPLREEGVENLLDSCNPLTWWRVGQKIRQGGVDLVIIPWWTSFWTPQFWTLASVIRRRPAIPILFICHNVVDHEAHSFSRLCTRAVLSKGNYFLVHSESDGKRLQALVPSARITPAFHPIYDFFGSGAMPKQEARGRLGLEGEILLFFGFIRPYKGISDLLRAMPLILRDRQVTLLVVGEFWDGKEAFDQLVKELKIEAAVKVIDKYVPNEEVGLYFSAADLVILPYLSGTGSGIMQIACGLEKPVVATRVGSLPEVVEDGRTGFLVNPGDPEALAKAVICYFAEGKEAEFVANIRKAKERFSWERMVQLIEAAVTDTAPSIP